MKLLLTRLATKIPFRVRLVEDWRHLWKAASVQYSSLGLIAFGILTAIRETWIQLPVEIIRKIPGASWIGMILFAAVLVGRFTMLIHKGRDHGRR